MKTSWTIAAVGLWAALASPARADVVTLTTTNPPGTPLTMAPNATSGLMTVGVANTAAPVDRMTGWFFTLMIVPDAGSTGTVTFASPPTGSPAHPPNYIFAQSFVGINVTNAGNLLRAFDDDNDVNGTPVPQAGASLLQLSFASSPTANGTFGVFAQEGQSNTGWTNQAGVTQFFGNVPNGTGSIRIAEVSVTGVPEPGTLVLTGLAGLAVAARRRRQNQPRRGGTS